MSEYDQVLQEFLFMLESNDLPTISVPNDALSRLIHLENTFFSTSYTVSALNSIDSFTEANVVFDGFDEHGKKQRQALLADAQSDNKALLATDDKNVVYFFAVGLSGYGIQNWSFCYFLSTPYLRMSIKIPYGNAYGDPEEEQNNVQTAVQLIEFCQNRLLASQENKLSLWLERDRCYFTVCTAEGETLKAGNELEDMIDFLVKNVETHQQPMRDWLAI